MVEYEFAIELYRHVKEVMTHSAHYNMCEQPVAYSYAEYTNRMRTMYQKWVMVRHAGRWTGNSTMVKALDRLLDAMNREVGYPSSSWPVGCRPNDDMEYTRFGKLEDHATLISAVEDAAQMLYLEIYRDDYEKKHIVIARVDVLLELELWHELLTTVPIGE